MVKAQPDGYHTVTPTIVTRGAGELIAFMTEVFGASERMRMPTPDGKVAHAEVMIGDSAVMVADEMAGFMASPAMLHLYVADVDKTFGKAVSAGASVKQPLQDQFYGDRSGTVVDRWGNQWTISTHKEDVSEEEMTKRMAAMAPA